MGACTVDNKTTLIVTSLTLTFAVAGDYALNGASFTVDSAKITSALTAIDRAKALAADIRSTYATDYARLQAIRDWICDSTSYNYSAAAGGVSYGDPWQMIYVFDQDDTTLVVCEGYAKATQYLCDLTLTQSQCYTVTGKMNGGAHMWNIVYIDGANYLLDLTSCDSGDDPNLRDWFFLVGADSGSITKGYEVSGSLPEGYEPTSTSYTYDSNTLTYLNSSALTLADSAYRPDSQTGRVPGDVNGNGVANLEDVVIVYDHVTSGGGYDAYYDINGDSVVDLKDVTRLLQYISGLITTL
jgi:hypothetical protein